VAMTSTTETPASWRNAMFHTPSPANTVMHTLCSAPPVTTSIPTINHTTHSSIPTTHWKALFHEIPASKSKNARPLSKLLMQAEPGPRHITRQCAIAADWHCRTSQKCCLSQLQAMLSNDISPGMYLHTQTSCECSKPHTNLQTPPPPCPSTSHKQSYCGWMCHNIKCFDHHQ